MRTILPLALCLAAIAGCPVDDVCASACRGEKDPAKCVSECEQRRGEPNDISAVPAETSSLPLPCGQCATIKGARDVLNLCTTSPVPSSADRWSSVKACVCHACETACDAWCSELSESTFPAPSPGCNWCATSACLQQLLACKAR